MEYSFRTFAGARDHISEQEKTRISKYTSKDVYRMSKEAEPSGVRYWQILTEATAVLFHHPNPIVRHEAAFVLGEFEYRDEFEKCASIRNLRIASRTDTSIVAKHEAIEALGETFAPYSVGAAADMAKILRWPEHYHPDIVATARGSFYNILKYMRSRGYNDAVKELLRWKLGIDD